MALSRRLAAAQLLVAAAYLHFLRALPHTAPSASPHCALLRRLDPPHTCAPPADPSHVLHCRPPTLAASAAVLDRFVVAHVCGWALKAVLHPVGPVLHAASLLFEAVERAARPLLPALAECWWDSLLLDAAFCNALGIAAGLAVARRTGRAPRARAAANVLVVVAFTVTDLNAFLLKHVLRLRAASYLHVLRIAFFAALAPRALHEIALSPVVAAKPPTRALHARAWERVRAAPWATVYVLLLSCEIAAVVAVWPVTPHGPT